MADSVSAANGRDGEVACSSAATASSAISDSGRVLGAGAGGSTAATGAAGSRPWATSAWNSVTSSTQPDACSCFSHSVIRCCRAVRWAVVIAAPRSSAPSRSTQSPTIRIWVGMPSASMDTVTLRVGSVARSGPGAENAAPRINPCNAAEYPRNRSRSANILVV